MNILLSNDDGIAAPGLVTMHQKLSDFANVTVVAPTRNRSAASNSLTLEQPIRMTTLDNGFISVNGTPTDCVHLAITGLLKTEPDIVVSGINSGPNLGDDVIYSGTVAAAMEGRFLRFPPIAVSLVGQKNYQSAAKAVGIIIKNLESLSLKSGVILNVNVPDIPWSEIKGIQVTRLGSRHKPQPIIKEQDPRGQAIYWVGPPGKPQDAELGTDFYAVKNNFVSVTPIHIDLTCHTEINSLNEQLAKLSND